MKYNCLVVLGPTASGKTALACGLAYELNGEVISADSRQVYQHLNIGTGKDLEEYQVKGKSIPYHLIDIQDPSQQFFLHEFSVKCDEAFFEIQKRQKLPIICGGTGLYLDTLRKDFSLTQVKENPGLRAKLESYSQEELIQLLSQFPSELTAHADISSHKRLIRAIEIAEFLNTNTSFIIKKDRPYKPYYIGINVSAEERKQKISDRLNYRLNNGMIEEVEELLKNGITAERLEFLGLEYKFISHYLQDKISRSELQSQLGTAIVQYSKRQMTWFRKMEREGVKINWVQKNSDPIQLAEQLKSELN